MLFFKDNMEHWKENEIYFWIEDSLPKATKVYGAMAAIFKIIVLMIIGWLELAEQLSLPSDATYNAGVVEFIPAKDGKGKTLVKDNLERMKSIIESEETENLDILVFPEFTLNNLDMLSYVPDPQEKMAPCELPNYDWFLTELSCSARSRKLYVVVNLLEKVKCSANDTHCELDGLKKFNTNVVFDREGRVISRYRKTHLYRYEWYSENVLEKPELATFNTDFGVTFGHFICFDMLFYEPAMVLLRQLNITDVVYPTYWFSELPFLTAVQLQEGWAFANNVNLLAADGSDPLKQNTGSGIYAGRLGRLAAAIYEVPTTKLLTAQVPKQQYQIKYQMPTLIKPLFTPTLESKRFTKMGLLRDYNVDIFNTTLLDDTFLAVNEILCHHDFCCDFHVERVKIADSLRHSSYRYRLAAYKGEQTTFQRIDSSNQSVCAVIACTGHELYTCGHIFPETILVGNKYYFKAINITAKFVKSARRVIMPSSVNSMMMPLMVDSFDWFETDSAAVATTNIRMNLWEPQQDLLTFGIWANYYSTVKNTHNLDHLTTIPKEEAQKPERNSSASMILSFQSLKIILFTLIISFSFH